jgi:hypothetical protein
MVLEVKVYVTVVAYLLVSARCCISSSYSNNSIRCTMVLVLALVLLLVALAIHSTM